MAGSKRESGETIRVTEDAEEGPHGRLDDPNTPSETGPIERGRVDAGPTGERGAYREPESGNRIMIIAAVAIVVILVVLAFAFLR